MCFLILCVSAFLSFSYFAALQVASPGTFGGTFFSFSAVWLYLAVFLAVLAFLEKRKGLKNLWLKIKKSVRVAICFVLALGIIISAVNLVFILNPKISNGSENCRFVIVLGGGITKDEKLTKNVENRIQSAAKYLKSHPDAIAVVSGGKGSFSPCPESDVLKPALASYGIDESRIFAEDKARDTIENLIFSAQILSEKENINIEEILSSPVAIATNSFHLARAERLAKRLGFKKIFGIPSKTPALFALNTYCREICAYVKLNLRILLIGKPKAILQ